MVLGELVELTLAREVGTARAHMGQKRVAAEKKKRIESGAGAVKLGILERALEYGFRSILQRVRELSGGQIEWTDGMLYPVLHRLERQGYVEARWETAESGRRRK